MSPLSRGKSIAGLVSLTIVTILLAAVTQGGPRRQPIAPPCRPLDSAWAVAIRVIDADTRLPVSNASVWAMTDGEFSDSTGWVCLRQLGDTEATLTVTRRGYEDVELQLAGKSGDMLLREVVFQRLERPCCDVRGTWRITLQLDSPSHFHPKPKGRTTAGEVRLGFGDVPAEVHDAVDSLVRVARGLHSVDFTPFFDGPYARDVSTSVFGGGPNLLREVAAEVPFGDSVRLTFIPRMSHGGLSLRGRILGDSVSGTWVQNSNSRGAYGTFVMIRAGPFDPSQVIVDTASRPQLPTRRRTGPPPQRVDAGSTPASNWRPELAVAPHGRLWLATSGLFIADTFGGEWRRVLGGPTDGVGKDELRIGVVLSFVRDRIAILGLPWRYHSLVAPVVYRTTDRGRTWSSIHLGQIHEVRAASAIDSSVWLVGDGVPKGSDILHVSADAGRTWQQWSLPPLLRDVTRMFRMSAESAYVATRGRPGHPALWHTVDGGRHWNPVPSPHDQRVQVLSDYESRIEQIARVGTWLIVREHGKVFFTEMHDIRWRELPDLAHVTSESNGRHLFALDRSLHPVLMDSDLQIVWRTDHSLPLAKPGDIEQVLWNGGVGYVSMTNGTLHRVRAGSIRSILEWVEGSSR